MRRRGLTLLELLLVVTILATVALSAVAVVGDADQQVRYEDTKTRLELIRKAIVGQADVAQPGRGQASGFVADMGRLPEDLTELLTQDTDYDGVADADLPAYQVDAATGVGSGWRGPYLRALPALTGFVEFHDGWGNWDPARDPQADPLAPPALNHGWTVTPDDEDGDMSHDAWEVQSLGPDGAASSDDYPATGAAPLVALRDHHVDVGGWSVTVILHNTDTAAYATGVLRLQLAYPDGAGGVTTYDSEEEPGVTVPAETKLPVTLTFPAAERWVPWGARTLRVFREEPAGSGTFVVAEPAGAGQRLVIDLIPRTALPSELPVAWRLQ